MNGNGKSAQEAIKTKACPACGYPAPKARPRRGFGWRNVCRCGAKTEYCEDPRDADIAWNAWVTRAERRREERM